MGPCCRWETFFVCPVTIAAPPSKSGKTTKLTPNGQLSPLPATPPSLPCQWQQQKNQHSAYCRSCLETHPRHLPSPLQESPHARPHDCKGFCSQFGVSHMCFCHFFASLGKLPFVFLIHFSRHPTFISRLMRPQWQRSSPSSQHRIVLFLLIIRDTGGILIDTPLFYRGRPGNASLLWRYSDTRLIHDSPYNSRPLLFRSVQGLKPASKNGPLDSSA
jgi:hypothetical protein